MKLPWKRWLATAVLSLLIVFAIPQSLHRRDFDRAYVAYVENPNPQTEAEFKREQRNHDIAWLKFLLPQALCLFLGINVLWAMVVWIRGG